MVGFEKKDKYLLERLKMVREQIRSRGITDDAVLDAISEIPREEFIPETYHFQAYSDGPVPIGLGQTISQPYIVALMSQALQVNSKCNVLEIGTGSGYQTAILAKIAKRVYTVERLDQLSEMAQAILGRLGISNVEYYIGDGTCGWPEPMQFERIIITAAAPEPPQPLVEQLADGGLMVIPVGDRWSQRLTAMRKRGEMLHESFICDCRFVPLTGKYGFSETPDE
jgi:protein-L-isoaspartate(D-aspartate) O-methyltransferase